jgi:hypothetical protein
MGQTSSSSASASAQHGGNHKHFRSSEHSSAVKSPVPGSHSIHPGGAGGYPSSTMSGYSLNQQMGGGGGVYHHDQELIEDEGISCLNPSPRGSYVCQSNCLPTS